MFSYSVVALYGSDKVASTDVANGLKRPSLCLSRLIIKIPALLLSKQSLALKNKQTSRFFESRIANMSDPRKLHSVFTHCPWKCQKIIFSITNFVRTCQVHWKRKYSVGLTSNSPMLFAEDGCNAPFCAPYPLFTQKKLASAYIKLIYESKLWQIKWYPDKCSADWRALKSTAGQFSPLYEMLFSVGDCLY